MLRALPALFDQLATHNHVPGAQFTLYHDGRLLELVAGVEHIHRRTPVTSRSRFALGSVSKVITAAAVMQLLEDGDVDFHPVPNPCAGKRRRTKHFDLRTFGSNV